MRGGRPPHEGAVSGGKAAGGHQAASHPPQSQDIHYKLKCFCFSYTASVCVAYVCVGGVLSRLSFSNVPLKKGGPKLSIFDGNTCSWKHCH